jgi:hypothetical protein
MENFEDIFQCHSSDCECKNGDNTKKLYYQLIKTNFSTYDKVPVCIRENFLAMGYLYDYEKEGWVYQFYEERGFHFDRLQKVWLY